MAIEWTGFTKNNYLTLCIRYMNALTAVIIFIGTHLGNLANRPPCECLARVRNPVLDDVTGIAVLRSMT